MLFAHDPSRQRNGVPRHKNLLPILLVPGFPPIRTKRERALDHVEGYLNESDAEVRFAT